MNKKMLEESIKYIEKVDNVSFVELLNHLEDLNFNVKGELNIILKENLVLWIELSEDFVKVFEELKKQCPVISCHPIIYFLDGAGLTLKPVNFSCLKNNFKYKNTRWLPVVFRKKSDLNVKNAVFVYN